MYTQEDFHKDHIRFSLLSMYPPFAGDDDLQKAFSDEVSGISKKEFYGKEKYADKMEEAELYQKRYGTDFQEALDAYKKDK